MNLTWIYRAKKYYGMSAAQIYALIVPIHYRLTREQIRRMAEAADVHELLEIMETTKYGRYIEGEDARSWSAAWTRCRKRCTPPF